MNVEDLVKKSIPESADLTGRKFGEWSVLEYAGTKNGHYFLCVCSCGKLGLVQGGELRIGRSASCGHSGASFKHGMAKRENDAECRPPEYNVWVLMRNRCNNRKAKGYSNYGGRGISVCERWDNFQVFLSDMGPRPSDLHSIDRIDNNGNYEPGNCRWVLVDVQRRNSRKIISVTHNGVTMCAKDWCEKLNLKYSTIYMRSRRLGISFSEALFGKED